MIKWTSAKKQLEELKLENRSNQVALSKLEAENIKLEANLSDMLDKFQ